MRSIQEFADDCGVLRQQVERWIKAKRILAEKVGRTWVIKGQKAPPPLKRGRPAGSKNKKRQPN